MQSDLGEAQRLLVSSVLMFLPYVWSIVYLRAPLMSQGLLEQM